MRSQETRSLELRSKQLNSLETRDSVREVMMVAERDTLREVTTITVQTNERGDTIKVVQITDLTRARNRDTTSDTKEKTVVRTDTVYIERRDSAMVSTTNCTNFTNNKEGFWTKLRKTLKWVLAVIVATTVFFIIKK
jgi:ABC-type sugar transport system permease subunit